VALSAALSNGRTAARPPARPPTGRRGGAPKQMICVRHGLMVVGPTGGGKSENIRTLKEASAMCCFYTPAQWVIAFCVRPVVGVTFTAGSR